MFNKQHVLRASILLMACVGVVSLGGTSPDGGAAEGRWSYRDLAAAADVTAIATLESSRVGSRDLYHGDLVPAYDLDVLVSTFDVASTLRGSENRNSIEVVHLRRNMKGVGFDTSDLHLVMFEKEIEVPDFITVHLPEGKSYSASGVRKIKPEYLLFLKSRKDGRYELASEDQNGISAVRIINISPDTFFDSR